MSKIVNGLKAARDYVVQAVDQQQPYIAIVFDTAERGTHITHLLRSGVPVHVVSTRAGHATPSITLNSYAHMLPGQQEGAAAVVDLAMRAALEE